ncbi:hypothetical protein [Rhodopirellula sp. MGV]|uniref:hypothetical protein n=1 Tax=Rhodopirellula sp. MGV TaxID=2023130 RepID=UPI000B968AEE|nr:hypothetical protein [Rhodopirellula sp. MGV]OYP38489.1 hypothetical protein CGZ80_01685 [Rhodopirellula sp. MGV]PNY33501.1 hypothetical protein C2E31_28185 [Rhodopirellula baltica]
MKRIALAFAALAIAFSSVESASAASPFGYPFVPFGFYQPYGAQYGSSMPTPPYFALNPPVYYGARHARPYGMSPFASPPMVTAGNDYRGRLRSEFVYSDYEKPVDTSCNPCISHAKPVPQATLGAIKNNPFVTETKIAQK